MKNKSTIKKSEKLTLSDRFILMSASLFFSIPTMIFAWLSYNLTGVFWGRAFLSADFLWLVIAIFAALSFIAPNWISNCLGKLWKSKKWWGW